VIVFAFASLLQMCVCVCSAVWRKVLVSLEHWAACVDVCAIRM
jgi:hypothetical protein